VNMAQSRDRYRHVEVDRQFGALLDRIEPDVVHVGHLSHLSTSLLLEASRRGVPVVLTLHDYWLMCPRGQFIQLRPRNSTDLWALCDGQEHRKCAEWNEAVQAAYEAAELNRLPNGEKVLLENIFPLVQGADVDIAPGAVCPFLGKEAWVSAQGRFDPCCAPDALRRTLGEFGNVQEQSLYEIWQSSAYRELLDTYLEHPLCQGCNMRRPEEL